MIAESALSPKLVIPIQFLHGLQKSVAEIVKIDIYVKDIYKSFAFHLSLDNGVRYTPDLSHFPRFGRDHNMPWLSSGRMSRREVHSISNQRKLRLVVPNDPHHALPMMDPDFQLNLIHRLHLGLGHEFHHIDSQVNHPSCIIPLLDSLIDIILNKRQTPSSKPGLANGLNFLDAMLRA